MIPGEFQLNFLAGNLENKNSLLGVRIDLFPFGRLLQNFKEVGGKKTVKQTQLH